MSDWFSDKTFKLFISITFIVIRVFIIRMNDRTSPPSIIQLIRTACMDNYGRDSRNYDSSIFLSLEKSWHDVMFLWQSHEYHVLDSNFQKSHPALKRQNSATQPEFPTKIFVEKTKFRNLLYTKHISPNFSFL